MTAATNITPWKLPRDHPAPAALQIGFQSHAAGEPAIPGIVRLAIDLSRNISLDGQGLPSCSLELLRSTDFSPRTTCTRSLVGRGAVTSEIKLPGKAPVMVTGRLLAFYSSNQRGEHILARVVTGEPLPLAYVLPFMIVPQRGRFATRLLIRRMRLIQGICAPAHPYCFGNPYTLEGVYGHIAAFDLTLQRRFRYRGKSRSFLSASCDIPPELPLFVLPWARVALNYEGGGLAQQITVEMCQGRG
jgi:hypothetical protein